MFVLPASDPVKLRELSMYDNRHLCGGYFFKKVTIRTPANKRIRIVMLACKRLILLFVRWLECHIKNVPSCSTLSPAGK